MQKFEVKTDNIPKKYRKSFKKYFDYGAFNDNIE